MYFSLQSLGHPPEVAEVRSSSRAGQAGTRVRQQQINPQLLCVVEVPETPLNEQEKLIQFGPFLPSEWHQGMGGLGVC